MENVTGPDIIRFDKRQDKYYHMTSRGPGRYHCKTALQAALERQISRAARLAKEAKTGKLSGQTPVRGRVK